MADLHERQGLGAAVLAMSSARTTRRGRYVSHQLDLPATAALGSDLIAVLLR